MLDKYGLFFNILQLGTLYMYYLGVKNKKYQYCKWCGLVYLIAPLLSIVRYTILTFILFIIQILFLMVFPPKNNKQ